AYNVKPAFEDAAIASNDSSVKPVSSGSRNAEPAEARKHLGFEGLTAPFRNIAPVAPNASAVRRIVPALPGSCTPSRITISAVSRTKSCGVHAFSRTSVRTPWGDSVDASLLKI